MNSVTGVSLLSQRRRAVDQPEREERRVEVAGVLQIASQTRPAARSETPSGIVQIHSTRSRPRVIFCSIMPMAERQRDLQRDDDEDEQEGVAHARREKFRSPAMRA